eukprot:TRINITY_DN14218_c0_g1_i1.p2 TRINITY_DN14218_c0_g1~~TRINITY_DN14218_c0_g1_i1.p2  ORF type:complete len:133 (+),score=8.14 TRINITY_DN14218_c0_g1_i1:666-1064(+)
MISRYKINKIIFTVMLSHSLQIDIITLVVLHYLKSYTLILLLARSLYQYLSKQSFCFSLANKKKNNYLYSKLENLGLLQVFLVSLCVIFDQMMRYSCSQSASVPPSGFYAISRENKRTFTLNYFLNLSLIHI